MSKISGNTNNCYQTKRVFHNLSALIDINKQWMEHSFSNNGRQNYKKRLIGKRLSEHVQKNINKPMQLMYLSKKKISIF